MPVTRSPHLAAAILLALPVAAHAQRGNLSTNPPRIATIYMGGAGNHDSNASTERVVSGRVQDKDGKAIPGAVVYLKETAETSSTSKSPEAISVITDDTGAYRFVALKTNTDYQLWAQQTDKKSRTRILSSFDNTMDLKLNLKIE